MANPNPPTLNQPSQDGLLSNTLGSTTTIAGSNSIVFSSHYKNAAGSSDPIACIRAIVKQTAQLNYDPMSEVILWDSGWTGIPPVQSIPTASSEAGTPISGTYKDRVYIMFSGQSGSNVGSGNVWSASVKGGMVGTWRQENSLGPTSNWFPTGALGTSTYLAGCTQLVGYKGWLYACVTPQGSPGTTAVLLGAPINLNGSLGNWEFLATAPYNLHSNGMMCVGRPNRTSPSPTTAPGNLFIMGGYNTSGNQVSNCSSCYLNSDGTLTAGTTGSWFAQSSMPIARQNGQVYYDNNYPYIYIVGGDSGATPANLTIGGSINNSDIVTWSSNITNGTLVANKTLGALVVTLGPDYATHFWYLGGCATTAGAQTSTVYHTQLTSPGACTGWTTAAFSLPQVPTATNWAPQLCAWSGSTPGASAPGINQLASPGTVGIGGETVSGAFPATIGETGDASGTTGALPWIAYMYQGSTVESNSPHSTVPASWKSGNAPGLAVSDLGGSTKASITSNLDGSQDIEFCFRGWGGIQALSSNAAYAGGVQAQNGYQIELEVQYISIQGGISSIGYAMLNCGQGPTLSNVTPTGTVTNAQPTLGFAFIQGIGGKGEYTYDIQVKNPSGTVIFDTGLLHDNVNSIQLKLAQLLAKSTTYTLVISVFSQDTVYPGSYNYVVSSTTFTTSAFSTPSAPTGFTAVKTDTNGSVALNWSSVSGASYYRVYWNPASTGWLLYADNVSGTSYTAMDRLPVGMSVQWAVSAVNAVPGEGSMSSTVTTQLSPGYWSAYLHVVGKGTTYGIASQIQDTPNITETIDSTSLLAMGQGAPITRYGENDYRQVQGNVLLIDATPASIQAFQAIMDQVKAGGVCYYRDAIGGCLPCTFDNSQGLTIVGPWNRQIAVKLTEVADLSGPYIGTGYAVGYQTLVNGRVPPIATVERLL